MNAEPNRATPSDDGRGIPGRRPAAVAGPVQDPGPSPRAAARRIAGTRAVAELAAVGNSPEAAADRMELDRLIATLRAAREELGLSAEEVAGRARFDAFSLRQIEAGRHTNPSFGTLCRYAAAVGRRVTLDTIAVAASSPDAQ